MRRKKRWGYIKACALCMALLGGGALAAEDFFQWSRLRTFVVHPEGVIAEEVLWSLVPRGALRCWWIFPESFRTVEDYLDRMYPVRANLDLVGFGDVVCSVVPLHPVLVVRWRGEDWYLDDEEGAIWRTDLPENLQVQGLQRPEGPPLEWGEDMLVPVAPAGEDRRVFRSRIPSGLLRAWHKALDTLKIRSRVERWRVRKCKGLEFVEITLPMGGHSVTVVLDGTNAAAWVQMVPAVEKIVGTLGGGTATLVADTTYGDKIVVRKNYQ
ncbi:MAG TPA: hypothetical protein PL162_08515 [Synergistaceae bacterium]|nr:hypothetical protein [Synergistaceae bacterium]